MTQLRLNPNLLKVPLYIAGKSIEEVQEELGLDEITKLGSNENPLGPSPLAVEAAAQMLAEAHRYPNYWEKQLRRRLAPTIDPSFTEQHILTGNGGCDVLRIVTQAFMSEGGEAITASAIVPMQSTLPKETLRAAHIGRVDGAGTTVEAAAGVAVDEAEAANGEGAIIDSIHADREVVAE